MRCQQALPSVAAKRSSSYSEAASAKLRATVMVRARAIGSPQHRHEKCTVATATIRRSRPQSGVASGVCTPSCVGPSCFEPSLVGLKRGLASRAPARPGSFKLKHVGVESRWEPRQLGSVLHWCSFAPSLVWVRTRDHSLARLLRKLSSKPAFIGSAPQAGTRASSAARNSPDGAPQSSADGWVGIAVFRDPSNARSCFKAAMVQRLFSRSDAAMLPFVNGSVDHEFFVMPAEEERLIDDMLMVTNSVTLGEKDRSPDVHLLRVRGLEPPARRLGPCRCAGRVKPASKGNDHDHRAV